MPSVRAGANYGLSTRLMGRKNLLKRTVSLPSISLWCATGIPVLGVIYLPVKRQLYIGADGMGAYKLGDITALKDTDTLERLIARADKLPLQSSSEPFCHCSLPLASQPRNRGIYRAEKNAIRCGRVDFERKLYQDLPGSRRGCSGVSSFCSYHANGIRLPDMPLPERRVWKCTMPTVHARFGTTKKIC